jgi:hypothetical protein
MAEAKLTLWLAAEEALAVSQSYEITVEGNTRRLTRANLKEIAQRIDYWQAKVTALTNASLGTSRTRYMVN